MKMTSIKMKRLLEERLNHPEWRTSYNRDKNIFRVEWKDTHKGIEISLPGIISKYEQKQEAALDDLEEHIIEALKIMNETHQLVGMEKSIYPVIRAASFPTESNAGKALVHDEHTAETRIYYALDLGKSYRLIDEEMLQNEGWDHERIKEVAKFNVRSLKADMRQDDVAGNTFYFVSSNDGYDASRILNEALLEEMKAKCIGELAIGIPHGDVCIFADIQNAQGYDILAQMTMKFFAEGLVPITSLPFLYEDKQLDPIFILAKNKPKDQKD